MRSNRRAGRLLQKGNDTHNQDCSRNYEFVILDRPQCNRLQARIMTQVDCGGG